MNSVSIIGRLTRDPVVRYTQGQDSMAIANFTVAVRRRGKTDEADFISCTAFGKTGENIGKYFQQGHLIGLSGHIQTGSYTNREGQKVYTTDVIVDSFDFLMPKETANSPVEAPKEVRAEQTTIDDFMSLPDDLSDVEGLPFA